MLKQTLSLALLLVLIVGATAVSNNPAAVTPVPDLTPYPWFYLRGGASLDSDENLVELLLVGDLSFGRETADGYHPAPAGSLAAVAPWLRSPDLSMGNLESVLVAGDTPPVVPGEAYLLRGEPAAALTLASAGFDLLGVANNHAFDYGPAGLATSNSRLRQLGVVPVNSERLLRQINGVCIAFLAFNRVPSAAPSAPIPLSEDAMISAVAAARAQADAVIVSVHWGYEYDLRPDPSQERLATALIAAGADVIAGHHPHVVQPVTVVDGGLVAYSLGNFLFDQDGEETSQGLALRVFLDRQGLRAVQALPVHANTRPALLPATTAQALLARVAPPPRRLGFVAAGVDRYRTVPVSQQAADGHFWSGEADLTGDGQPERVRREGHQVRIYGRGQLLWQSPPAWEVVDLALGDPNDDGRQEVILAVWKTDPAGYRRSHPYLVGYRGGEYTLIWGGRAVMDPIQELALGDVDGDGRQEFLVLLEDSAGERSVAVWRWHGWGFGLLWRSSPGPYRDLLYLPGSDTTPPAFSVALASE